MKRHGATILIKMLPGEGANSIQTYMRDNQSKYEDHDKLEDELYAELLRREVKDN